MLFLKYEYFLDCAYIHLICTCIPSWEFKYSHLKIKITEISRFRYIYITILFKESLFLSWQNGPCLNFVIKTRVRTVYRKITQTHSIPRKAATWLEPRAAARSGHVAARVTWCSVRAAAHWSSRDRDIAYRRTRANVAGQRVGVFRGPSSARITLILSQASTWQPSLGPTETGQCRSEHRRGNSRAIQPAVEQREPKLRRQHEVRLRSTLCGVSRRVRARFPGWVENTTRVLAY